MMYQSNPEELQDYALLKIQQIIGNPKLGIPALIPISRSNFWNRVKTGQYPQPVRLGPKSVAWRAYEIKALIRDMESTLVPGTRGGAGELPRKKGEV
jgi:prophage regulatory protein